MYFPLPILGASSPRIFHPFNAISRDFLLSFELEFLDAFAVTGALQIRYRYYPNILITFHNIFINAFKIRPSMMNGFFSMICCFALVRTITISTTRTLYYVILRFSTASCTSGAHVHASNKNPVT